MPSLLIIMFIAWALSRVNLDWLNRAFAGIRPTVVALIASAAYSMGRKILRDQRAGSSPCWQSRGSSFSTCTRLY